MEYYFSVLVVAAEDGRRTECHVFAPSDRLGRVRYTFVPSGSISDAYYSTPVRRLDS
jgi:hypothetical protein